jgi:hypothetical protein
MSRNFKYAYSYLKALTGSNLVAFIAGYIPAKIPTTTLAKVIYGINPT